MDCASEPGGIAAGTEPRSRRAAVYQDRPAPPPPDGRAFLCPDPAGPAARDPRGCALPFARRTSLWRRLRPRENAATLLRSARAATLALAGLAVLAVGLPEHAEAQTEVPADWALKPADIAAGEQFRLMFVTSTGRDALSTDIADYNTFVRTRAAAGVTAIQTYANDFTALASTESVNARANTLTRATDTDVPIYWVRSGSVGAGDRATDDYADFYDATWKTNAIGRNESGVNMSFVSTSFWTGTNTDGTTHATQFMGATGSGARVIRWRVQSSSIVTSNSPATSSSYRIAALSPVFQVAGTATTSSDATLSALALEDASDDSAITISPVFASGTTSYTASVVNGVDEITIEPTVNESSATVEYLDSSDTEIADSDSGKTGQQVSLSVSANTIKVKVTAEDTTTTDTYTVVVTRAAATNTPPTAANNTVTTGEDRAYAFTADDFGFDDADAGATLASVTIVTVPAAGTLALDGTAVLADDVVTKAQIDGDMLTFTPARDAHGAPYTTFTFTVNDGTDDSASAYTMTIDVTDAPVPVCGPPNIAGAGRRQIWTSTMTVEARTLIDVIEGYGFSEFGEGELALKEFDIGSNNYTIDAILVGLRGRLVFSLDGNTGSLTATETAALRLHVCDEDYDFSTATTVSADISTFNWTTSLDWSPPVESRTVYLSLPANNAATGEPAITGTAQAGQELTADASPIMDTDGVPSSFTYQWVRVDADGTSNEEDISGEIAATYTLTNDDVGKKIKVKVSFTDELSGEEERTSAAYPSSGTVTVAANTTAPALLSVTVTSTPRKTTDTYGAREHIEFSMTFDAPVTVTGDPTFAFDLGGPTTASWYAGSGTTTLRFSHAVTGGSMGDRDTNGIAWAENAIALNGGTIAGTDNAVAAVLTHVAQSNLADHKVDGRTTAVTAATVTDVVVTSTPMLMASGSSTADTYGFGETIVITVTVSEAVEVEGDPVFRFSLTNPGSAANNPQATYDRTRSIATTIVFTYTVQAGDRDTNGIWIGTHSQTFSLDANDRIRTASQQIDIDRNHLEKGTQGGHKVDGSLGAPTVPPDPTAPTLVSATATTLTIEWTHPGDGGSPLTRNFIEYRVEGTTDWTNWYRGETPTPVTRAVITNLQAATAYDVRVHSTNAIGNSSWTQSATAFSTLAGTAATGAPAITGTAAVGQPLAVDLTGIEDADGLTNVSYSYQWVRVDADGTSNEADITDETDATYTQVDADLGKTLKVRVTFDDDAGNTETLTSAATATVTPAAGAPSSPTNLSATVGVGQVVLVWQHTSGGGTRSHYEYRSSPGEMIAPDAMWQQVLRSPGTLNQAYYQVVKGLTSGTTHTFQVRAANPQGGSAPATVTATPVSQPSCTIDELGDRRLLWQGQLTAGILEIYTDGNIATGYGTGETDSGTLTPAAFTFRSTTYSVYMRTYDDFLNAVLRDPDFTVWYPREEVVDALRLHVCNTPYDFSSATSADAISEFSGYRWNIGSPWPPGIERTLRLSLPPNHPATGDPVISGTVQVGEELTALTDGIMDEDELDDVFTYQWVRVDADGTSNEEDITDATAATYTLTDDERGKKVKVEVRFVDILGGEETRTSAPTETVPGVTVSTTALTVTEEDTTGASYTVVLNSQPTATVTVTVAGHAGTDVTLTPSSATLTFTPTTWGTAQTVTVTAGPDADAANDAVSLTHSAASTDSDYQGITIAGVAVTVTDNDDNDTPPGVTVSTPALTVTEEDTAGARYTVVLNSQPTATVTVTVAGHAGTDVTLTPSSATLTFTPMNWGTAQTVTVTAGADADAANESVSLTHSAASTDSNYQGITIGGVAVTVRDNDTPPPSNNAPTVSSVSCDPCAVAPGGEVRLSAEASDPDGDSLTYAWSAPTGSFTGATDGAAARWRAPAETARVTVRVQVSDGRGGTASATVTVEVGANAPPAFEQSSYGFELPEHKDGRRRPVALGAVKAEDPDGAAVTYSLASGDGERFAVGAHDGAVTYVGAGEDFEAEPNQYELSVRARDQHGAAARVRVTVAVTNANEPPSAEDDEAGTAEDQRVVINVLANDTDPDGDSLRVESVSAPAHGMARVASSGGVAYTPDADYHGLDRFTYVVADGHGETAAAAVEVTVAPVNDAPMAAGIIPDQRLSVGDEPGSLDLRPFFDDRDGDPLSYTAVASDTAVAVGLTDATLTLTVARPGAAMVTVTAQDPGGLTATQAFMVTTVDRQARGVIEDTLAALGRGHLASARATLGRRVETTGQEPSHVTVAGLHVPLVAGARAVAAAGQAVAERWITGLAGGMPLQTGGWAGTDAVGAPGSPAATLGMAGGAPFGAADPAQLGARATPALSGVSPFGGGGQTDFLLTLGTGQAGSDAAQGPRWTVWGQSDLQSFAGERSPTARYDGDLWTTYVGVDARLSERWLAGVAVSRSRGNGDWTVGSSTGRLTTTLTSVQPYLRWSDGGTTIWATGGGGPGTARNALYGLQAESDLELRLGLVEVRRRLATVGGGVELQLRGDASWARLTTAEGDGLIDALAVEVRQLRVGIDVSRPVRTAGGTLVEPFGEVHARRDGGVGQTGVGLEVAGGLRVARGVFRVEGMGRLLALHAADGYRERGAAVTLSVGDGARQPGLTLSLSPRWGAQATASDALWQDQLFHQRTAGDPGGRRDERALDARVDYGLPLPAGGLLTPFGIYGQSRYGRRLQVGLLLSRLGPVGLEVSGERAALRQPGRDDYRISALGSITFGGADHASASLSAGQEAHRPRARDHTPRHR